MTRLSFSGSGGGKLIAGQAGAPNFVLSSCEMVAPKFPGARPTQSGGDVAESGQGPVGVGAYARFEPVLAGFPTPMLPVSPHGAIVVAGVALARTPSRDL